MSAQQSLLTELENALSNGNADRRSKTLRRITDLFVFESGRFSKDHVDLFDDVFGRLINDIETSARSMFAERLAGIANPPPSVIHTQIGRAHV